MLAAGKNNHLDVSGRHVEDVEYAAHPPVVRKHKGVIKNDGGRVALLDQHLREGQPDEDSNLFLGAHAEVIEGFLVARFSHHPGNVKVLIDPDLGTGEQELKIWLNTSQHGRTNTVPWLLARRRAKSIAEG